MKNETEINQRLLSALKCSFAANAPSDDLISCLNLMISELLTTSAYVQCIHPTEDDRNDIRSHTMLILLRTWNRFSMEKSSFPFGYFHQCIEGAFAGFAYKELRHRG